MNNLYVISLATDYTNAVDNFKKSCSKNNLNCKIIGLNQEFKGWRWRMKMYIEAIKYYNDDDIIIFSDCYDVIVQENKETIIKKFKKLNKKVIISSEMNLLLLIELKQFKMHPQLFTYNKFLKNNLSDYIYPCLGLVIGYKKDILNLYKLLLNYKHPELHNDCYEDDQCLFSFYFTKNGNKLFDLDYKQTLFGNMSGSLNRYEVVDNKLYNSKMNSTPSFLHFQGNSLSFYNYYFMPLGYKEIDNKPELLPIKSKMLKNVFDSYQEFWWQNIFQEYNNFSNQDNFFYRSILISLIVIFIILFMKLNNKI